MHLDAHCVVWKKHHCSQRFKYAIHSFAFAVDLQQIIAVKLIKHFSGVVYEDHLVAALVLVGHGICSS